jgi:hypothetical protein
MKIIDSVWYGVIGIVMVQSEYEGTKLYIGQGKGFNQKEDEDYIAKWGMTFNPNDKFFERKMRD